MSVLVEHQGPWTVDDVFALPDLGDGQRHELVDGALLVSPAPGLEHQRAAGRLRTLLAAVAPVGTDVVEAMGVVLPAGLFIPDVVVTTADVAPRELKATDVVAVVEIVSPTSRRQDRLLKPACYAEAGIPTFWRVELDAEGGPEVVVHRLDGDVYREEALLRAGETAEIPWPFPVSLDPATLIGPPAPQS